MKRDNRRVPIFWRRSSSPAWGAALGLITAAIVWPGPALNLFGARFVSAYRPFRWLDMRLGDALQTRSSRAQPPREAPRIVIVGMDQKSAEQFRAATYPRDKHADLILKLKKAGARVIALDIYFDTPSGKPEHDRKLKEAIRQARNVVLPTWAQFAADSGDAPGARQTGDRAGAQLTTTRTSHRVIEAGVRDQQGVFRAVLPARHNPFYAAAAGIGHINVFYDEDNVVRRVPALVGARGASDRYLPLSLVAALLYRKQSPSAGRPTLAHHTLSAGDLAVPTDASGSVIINYLNHSLDREISEFADLLSNIREAPIPITFYSYADVYNESPLIPKDAFRDAIVLVGHTLQGSTEDRHITPHGQQFGVFVQAMLMHTILCERFLRPASLWVTFLALLAVSTLLGGILFRIRLPGSVYATVLGGILLLLILCGATFWAGLLLRSAGIIVELLPFLMVIAINVVGATAANATRTGREIERHEMALDTLRAIGEKSTIALPEEAAPSHPLGEVADHGNLAISSSVAARSPQIVLESAAQALPAEGCSLHLLAEQQEPDSAAPVIEDSLYRGFRGRLRRRHAEAAVHQLLPEVLKHKGPLLRRDIELDADFFLLGRRLRQVLCVPLVVREDVLGLLMFYNKRRSPISPDPEFTEQDIRMILTFSHQAAIILENARQYRQQHDMFLGFARSLALAVDLRDKYTHGHSERVGAFALAIAKELGLTHSQQEIIEQAAILHDVGKIGVSDEVLNKPGRLSSEESALIRSHCIKGFNVLKETPRFRSLLAGVRSHHERYDGSGYPDGLKERSIALVARILAVADAYDAMTSDRVYRPRLEEKEALRRLRDGAGAQFDPDVVQAFLKCLRRGDKGLADRQTAAARA